MRRGIGLRGYAQQDPLNEFRKEAFRLYEELSDLIRRQVATTIFRVTVCREPATVPLSGPGQPARADPCSTRTPTVRSTMARRTTRRRQRQRVRSTAAGRRDVGRGGRRGGHGHDVRCAPRPPACAARRRACPRTRCAPRARCRATRRRRTASRQGFTPVRCADRAQRPVLVRVGPEVQEVSRGLSARIAGGHRALGRRRGPARRRCAAAFAALRIWQQGQVDEERPADAIVVLGAAQYDGRPSPVFGRGSTTRSRSIGAGVAPQPRRDRRQAAGRPHDRGGRRPALRDRPRRAGRGDLRRGRGPQHARLAARGRRAMHDRGLSSAVFVSDPTHMLRVVRIATRPRARGVLVADPDLARPGGPAARSPGRRSTSSARSPSTSSPAAAPADVAGSDRRAG